MIGDRVLVDTNAILYLLNGDTTLANILEGKTAYVSFVTELELFCFKSMDEEENQKIREVLNHCTIIDINKKIKEATIAVRQLYNLKLPDSIIAATAIYLDMPLLSADMDFKKISELNLYFFEF